MIRSPLLFLALTLASGAVSGAEPKQLATAVSPLLSDSTLLVIHVDLARLDLPGVQERLKKLTPALGPVLEKPLEQIGRSRKTVLDAGMENLFVVIPTTQEPNRMPLIALTQDLLTTGNPLEKVGELFPGGLSNVGGLFVAGSPDAIKSLRDQPQKAADALVADLTAAFENTSKAPVRAVLVLSPEMRRVLSENLATLPKPFDGVSGKFIAEGVRWAALALEGDGRQGYQARVHIQTADAETAAKVVTLAEIGLTALAAIPDLKRDFPVDQLRKHLNLRARDSAVVATLEDQRLVEVMLPAIDKMQYAAQASRHMNNLKQIGLAFHIYADANRSKFGTASITDNQGQPLLSWRVRLLPHLGDEGKKLYDRFKLNEPWDSEHNKKLIKEMPAVYQSSLDPKLAAEGKTTIVVPVGPDTIFPPGKSVGLVEITDGTSNTILALEVEPAKAVPWTKPDDLSVDLKNPLAGVGIDPRAGVFLTLFADGSVRRISKSIDPKTLAALLTRNGGEGVSYE